MSCEYEEEEEDEDDEGEEDEEEDEEDSATKGSRDCTTEGSECGRPCCSFCTTASSSSDKSGTLLRNIWHSKSILIKTCVHKILTIISLSFVLILRKESKNDEIKLFI